MHYSIILYIICSIVSFYFFYYIDALLILLVTSQVLIILCSHIISSSKHHCNNIKKQLAIYTIPYILEKHRMVVYYLLLVCIISYISGFRYTIASSGVRLDIDAANINASNMNININTNMNTSVINYWYSYWHPFKQMITQTLKQYNVQSVSQTWITMLSRYISKDTVGVLIGLITGNKDFIHLAFSDLVRRNGISHLLALSGFHLSILIMMFEYSARMIKTLFKITLHKLYLNMGIMIAVWIYCIWIGFIPSLYRAALMFSLSVFLKHIFGKNNFLLVWFLTGMILMLIYPSIMYAHGFILSMLALLGVVGGAHYALNIQKHIPPFIAIPLCIGIGATLCTAWYSVVVFGAAYPIGIFVSILLTPLIALFMVVGLVFIVSLSLFSNIPLLRTMLILIGKCLDAFIYVVRRVLIFFGNGIILDSVSKLIIFYIIIFMLFFIYAKLMWVNLRVKGNSHFHLIKNPYPHNNT